MRPMDLCVVTIVSISIVSVAGTAHAQNSNNGNPTILRATQDLQLSMNDLAMQLTNVVGLGGNITGQLTEIESKLTALSEMANQLLVPPEVISTGFLFTGIDHIPECDVQNVGALPVTLKMELLSSQGFLVRASGNVVIDPGRGDNIHLPFAITDNFWCRFTMVNGSSVDVRANLSVYQVGSGTTGVAAALREAR
jgi:hypothetical protein